ATRAGPPHRRSHRPRAEPRRRATRACRPRAGDWIEYRVAACRHARPVVGAQSGEMMFTRILGAAVATFLLGQQVPPAPATQPAQSAPPPPASLRPPTRADILRGEYGRYRSNNDLLSYRLDVRVDPEKKSIAGKNTIRFKML